MQRFVVIVLFFLAVACKKKESSEAEHLEELTQPNIAYGADTMQKMDIYLPADRDTSKTKLMVMIHGGGWAVGDKTDYNTIITDFKKRLPDYAFATINYRLYNLTTGQNKFPVQEEDVKVAISFLLNKRAEYRISNKIVLLGVSAGAHLALLQGYKYPYIVAPKGIIAYFGPTDLAYLYNDPASTILQPVILGVIGATPAQVPAAYIASSPISFVTRTVAPTLLLHGDADVVVPVSQSTMLADKLKAAGAPYEMVIYPNEPHGFSTPILDDSFTKTINFLKANVP